LAPVSSSARRPIPSPRTPSGDRRPDPKNFSIDPWHLNVPKPIANPVTSVVEKIPGSDLAADIIYVEMNDGTYSPIAMMKVV